MPIQSDFQNIDGWYIYSAISGGGGAGGATEAKQDDQIAQTTDGSGNSVYKKVSTGESWLELINETTKQTATFTEQLNKLGKVNAETLVLIFQDAVLATAAAAMETYLQGLDPDVYFIHSVNLIFQGAYAFVVTITPIS